MSCPPSHLPSRTADLRLASPLTRSSPALHFLLFFSHNRILLRRSTARSAGRSRRRLSEAWWCDLGLPAVRHGSWLHAQDDFIEGVTIQGAIAMHALIQKGAATLSF